MGFIGKQPAKAAITSSDITDGIVTADKLASNAVTTAKINADAVTDAKIADDVVGSEHLTAGEVDTTALGADAVTAAKIADDAISDEHLDPTAITGQTAETSAADDDLILLSDTSASAALKKMTRSNFLSGVGAGSSLFFQARHDTSQSVSNASELKLNYATEIIDTDSKYDTSTSRYTPAETGKYLIGATVRISGSSVSTSDARLIIKRNGSGSGVAVGQQTYSSAYYPVISVIGLVDVTSTSDYFEVYHFQKTGAADTYAVDASGFAFGVFYGFKIA